jgi:hypothetical protein
MAWKGWNREKSTFMLLGLAMSDEKDNEETNICKTTANQLAWIASTKYQNNFEYHPSVIENVQKLINAFNIDIEKIEDWWCYDYLTKASREINLQYMDDANKRYFEKFWKNAKDQNELYKKWFIIFNPKDYQQYETDWMIYYYNEEIKRFDRERRAK